MEDRVKWDLKPCPFSRNYGPHELTVMAVQFEDYSARRTSGPFYVGCSCTAGGPICPTQEDAVRKWNHGLP